MTPRQIELVQSSFTLVIPILEPATIVFYDRLFQLDPSLRRMFHGPMDGQARKLAHVLTVVVKGLSRPEQILPAVEELSRRHLTYGVRPEHYATVGAALLWTLQSGLGEEFTPEVGRLGPPRIPFSQPLCKRLPRMPKRRIGSPSRSRPESPSFVLPDRPGFFPDNFPAGPARKDRLFSSAQKSVIVFRIVLRPY
jgi:hemoglobin-like flavoprotein